MNYQELRALRERALDSLDQRLAGDEKIIREERGSYRLAGSYYEKQLRVALRNSEIINPESIEEYIATRGYEALADILETGRPAAEIVDDMVRSILGGRGGGGFATGRKWK